MLHFTILYSVQCEVPSSSVATHSAIVRERKKDKDGL